MKSVRKTFLVIGLAMAFSGQVLGAEAATDAKQKVDELNATVNALSKDVESLKTPSSIGFDLGFGVEGYKNSYIAEASVGGDGNVRVVDDYDVQPSFWLQFSWLADKTKFGFGIEKCNTVCLGGVFAGVRLAGQDAGVMDAFAFGIVLASFKVGVGDASQKSQISRFYVGYAPVVHRTKTFVSGISEGNPLPGGVTEITYRKSYETSSMLMLGMRF